MIGHVVKLMASGFFAAIGFMLFAKGFFVVEPEVVNGFLSLLAVQLLVVTLSVLGADRKILSSLSSADGVASIRVSTGFYAWLLLVFFSAIVFLLYFYGSSYWVALMLVFSAVLDALSVLRQARLSAQLETNKLLVSNLIRYPVFFALIWVGGELMILSLEILLALFFIMSGLRYVVLAWFERDEAKNSFVVQPDFFVGGYQGANYTINRGGQILIGFSFVGLSAENQSYFFLIWKIIEFVDKLILTVMPVIFNFRIGLSLKKSIFLGLYISLFSSIAFLFLYLFIVDDLGGVNFVCLFGFIMHVVLIYPSNIGVLLLIRGRAEKVVFNYSLIGLFASLLCFALLYAFGFMSIALAFFTPIGLLLMALLFLFNRRRFG